MISLPTVPDALSTSASIFALALNAEGTRGHAAHCARITGAECCRRRASRCHSASFVHCPLEPRPARSDASISRGRGPHGMLRRGADALAAVRKGREEAELKAIVRSKPTRRGVGRSARIRPSRCGKGWFGSDAARKARPPTRERVRGLSRGGCRVVAVALGSLARGRLRPCTAVPGLAGAGSIHGMATRYLPRHPPVLRPARAPR